MKFQENVCKVSLNQCLNLRKVVVGHYGLVKFLSERLQTCDWVPSNYDIGNFCGHLLLTLIELMCKHNFL